MVVKRALSELEKVPPQNLEAERAVLGAMLLDKEAIPKVLQVVVDPKSFYLEAHALIYEGIVSLFTENISVDVVSLRERFRKKGKLKEIGGASYLAELVNSVPSTISAPYYAQIIKEKQILRNLLRTACPEHQPSWERPNGPARHRSHAASFSSGQSTTQP